MRGLLKWTEGQLQPLLHRLPPAPTVTGCWGMAAGRRGRGGSSGPTDNDSGYSRGPSARITANLTAQATSRPPSCPTPIIKRNQQRPLLWPVLLLAGVQGALEPPQLGQGPCSHSRLLCLSPLPAHSVHSTAESVRSTFKNSKA